MTTPGTALGRPSPSLRLLVADDAGLLARALQEAVDLLVDVGRVRMAAPGEHPDLLHTVGQVDLRPESAQAGSRVHTVDRIALRGGPDLVPTWRWARRERRRVPGGTTWLAHGRTASRIVVSTARAPGERVHCLPVLAPAVAPAGDDPGGRQAARRRLGLHPGLHLVLWSGTRGHPAPAEWAAALQRRRPRDVRVLRIPAAPGEAAGLSLGSLLDAADLFVAADQQLAAVNPAVLALARGIPVVTTPTDSAADLVVPGRDGSVVDARGDAVLDAVLAALDAGTAPTHRRPRTPARPAVEDMARRLLSAYESARSHPAPWRRTAGR
jgi:glycosyltransferase involved in cell wall biosynthesis